MTGRGFVMLRHSPRQLHASWRGQSTLFLRRVCGKTLFLLHSSLPSAPQSYTCICCSHISGNSSKSQLSSRPRGFAYEVHVDCRRRFHQIGNITAERCFSSRWRENLKRRKKQRMASRLGLDVIDSLHPFLNHFFPTRFP